MKASVDVNKWDFIFYWCYTEKTDKREKVKQMRILLLQCIDWLGFYSPKILAFILFLCKITLSLQVATRYSALPNYSLFFKILEN